MILVAGADLRLCGSSAKASSFHSGMHPLPTVGHGASACAFTKRLRTAGRAFNAEAGTTHSIRMRLASGLWQDSNPRTTALTD